MGNRAVIHVGTHKTGTTAIQRFLADNEQALIESGVHRIKTGLAHDDMSWGHHLLVDALRCKETHVWGSVADEVRASQSEHVCLSAEDLCLLPSPADYALLRDSFEGRKIRIVCYLRRQDEFLESVYNHHVKSLGETRGISDFARDVAFRLDYKRLVEKLEVAFGREAITLRVYDKAHLDGDIFDDFLGSAFGLSAEGMSKLDAVINPGLSAAGVVLMVDANKKFQHDPDALAWERLTVILDNKADAFSRHSILPDNERERLLAKYEPGNDWIAKRYFNRERLFAETLTPAQYGVEIG